MGNLDLKAIDDKKTQEAFDWYRDKTSKMGGDKAFGSLTFAGITQHVARYALVKVGFGRKVGGPYWYYRGVTHQSDTFGHYLKHIRVKRLVTS